MLFWAIFSGPFKKSALWIANNVNPMRSYSLFSIGFLLLFIWGYAYLFVKYSENAQDLSNVISAYWTTGTLLFAAIVWYFAFKQLQESKIERLEIKGATAAKNGESDRALRIFSELHRIDPENFVHLATLVEMKIILKKTQAIKVDFDLLWKIKVWDREELIILYIEAVNEIYASNLKEFRAKIKKFCHKHKNMPANVNFRWSTDELIGNNSEFSCLDRNDQQRLLDFAKYIRWEKDQEELLSAIW